MADKEDKPQLQRRGGRRISIPSPISPSISKRYDRFYRSPEVLGSIDTHSTEMPTDAPLLDLTFPSTLFDDSTLISMAGGDGGNSVATVHMAATEEVDRNRNADQGDYTRASTSSSRGSESRHSQSTRPPFLSEMATKSSPLMGKSYHGAERNFESSVSAGRNYSTTSLSTDRSASDENVPIKPVATKKSRLTMLNPMSLIARRRSSQNTKLEEMNINISPVPAMPENFDPSIRGNFVHDFSRPRTKKSHFGNSPRREAFSSPVNPRRPSDFGTSPTLHGTSPSPALHNAMFREHFQDDDKTLQPGQTGYLHNVASSRKSFGAPPQASLPSFAQKLPATLPESDRIKIQKDLPPIHIPHPENPPPPPPKLTPPPASTPSPDLALSPAHALPKHMTSVSSRFSFQIAGQDSAAQEKLLEEKHKEHFAKDTSKPDKDEDAIDDTYGEYDLDADDDFEEKIPGVNTDYHEDDAFDNDDIPTRNIEVQSSSKQPTMHEQVMRGFRFTPDVTISPTSTYHASEPTPCDTDGFAIGIADSKDSPLRTASSIAQQKPAEDVIPQLFFDGLRISTVSQNQPPLRELSAAGLDSEQTFDDLDLYFDDGEFDMDDVEVGNHFDESLLDDEANHIRDIPAENAKRYEAALERSAPGDRIAAIDPNNIGVSRDTSSSSNFVNVHGADSSGFTSSREPERNNFIPSQTSGLTEVNLAAYHDALAEAANYAAANGKFNRQISFSSNPSNGSEPIPANNMRAVSATHDSKSQNDAGSEYIDDYEAFAFDDDDMDDDLMIAEANAEALENDDDGFYGQEFGFYARAHGKSNSESVNGGFFTARGSNGIKRSHSGKVNFQEPSLTPITERSEWSTRNSVAFGAQSLPSPDINHILSSPAFEDEMTLSALIKLRRSAFGESSTSINSLGDRSMPGSSPLAHVSSYKFPPSESQVTISTSGVPPAMMEYAEDDDFEGEQLTLTQNTPRRKIPGTAPATAYGLGTHLAVTESPVTSKKGHHRRNSSGADSVSYVRDQDGHWVLERRRTGDDGEQEIVEREYLAGARI